MGSGGARSPPPGTMATLQRGARQTALVEQNPKLPLAIGLKALALVADRYRDGRDVRWIPVETELLQWYKRWLTFKRDGALTLQDQQYWTNQLSKQVVFTKDFVMKWVKYKVLTATGCTFRDYRPFITGFLDTETEQSWGRPVDVQMLGADILVSDDKSNAIYRFRM